MELTDKVKSIIAAHVCGKAAAAVSGGRDSMCMLDCIVRFGLIPTGDLTVLHVNHMIRGEEADADEKLVSDWCAEHGVECRSFRINVPALAAEHGRSLETEARLARREVFRGFGGTVLTAHNKSDRTESVLMHIFRGCGINGLTGPTECDGFIIRPLIGCTRDEINEYVRLYRVPYSDDRTNADSDYARNYVRNKILPLIRSRYPGVDDAVSRLGDAARRVGRAEGVRKVSDGCAVISPDNVHGDSVLAALLAAGLDFDYTSEHIKAVSALASARTGAGVDLPRGYRAEKESGCVRIFAKETFPDEEHPFRLGMTRFSGGRYVLAERTDKRVDVGGSIIDLGKLPEDAVLRTRREGDTFVPYGGKRKSLSDWLIDKKIPRYLRARLLYVARGSEVLAVVGVATGSALATDENTTEALRLTVGREPGNE